MSKRIHCICCVIILSIASTGCSLSADTALEDSSTAAESSLGSTPPTAPSIDLTGNLLNNEPFVESDFPVKETKANLEKAKDACMPVLLALDTPKGENYMPENEDYTVMQESVAALGLAVSAYPWGTNNYQQVLDFCATVKACEDATVAIYDIRNTMIFAEIFVTHNGRVGNMTIYYDFPNASADDSNQDPISVGKPNELNKFTFTEKGYLLYQYRDAYGSEMDGGYRILPLGEEKQQLTEKYALYFDPSFNNIMTVNWDKDHLDELSMLFVFECFYNLSGHSATDDFPRTNIVNDINEEFFFTLPRETVEETLTTHLPVTVEYLRSMPTYDAALQTYNWRTIPRGGVSPTPEVVDVKENTDGSLTLTFDAVFVETGSDRQYSSTMTVKDNPDGSIQYLSNQTDYDVTYPYNTLRDLPVITVPVSDKDKVAFEAGGVAYQKFCQAISPYLLTHAPDHMQYAGTVNDIESNLRFVSYLFETGLVTPDFDYKACLDTATNTYAYPRNEMLEYMTQYFPNAPDVNGSYAIDYLRRNGMLDWERQTYLVPAGNYSYPGFYDFGWCGDNEDGTTSISVSYSEDGVNETILHYTFTIDFRQEPLQFLEVRVH